MDRIERYRQAIRDCLESFVERFDPQAHFIFDTERDRYLVMHNEWRGETHIYGCAMQLDLIDSQVWIQHNSTEIYLDRELMARGVAARDVILGFRSPGVRQLLAAVQKT